MPATSIENKNKHFESFDELVQDDDEDYQETEAEKKAKMDLLRGVIPIEYRDNIQLKRDEKAATDVASEFQRILEGLQMFGLSIEDLESHILPRLNHQQSLEISEQAIFVRDLRIQMKNQKHE